ncbi:hypothetical protein [Chryseobacterium sp. GM_Chr_2]|uniref:hypothetical protein n=1 Tax=Chryseobacterium sp. GM_Chr_2 TaxID=2937367 RepID=UPI002269D67B|nr:hypothetical protein [Chryseobacterium sp. GM_Chr_2]
MKPILSFNRKIIMKKIFTLSLGLAFSFCFSQGKLYLQNYSAYDLTVRIVAGNTTNCLPLASTSIRFPAATEDVIENFNDALPYTTGWSVSLTTGTMPTQVAIPSGLLTAISPLTRWEFAWYQAQDPITGDTVYDTVDHNMADNTAFNNCGWSGSTFIDGTITDSFWFYIPSENATYLVIQ